MNIVRRFTDNSICDLDAEFAGGNCFTGIEIPSILKYVLLSEGL